MGRLLVAGNWKMFKTNSEAVSLARNLRNRAAAFSHTELLIFPPFTALSRVAEIVGDSNIALGAQNLHWEEAGAFTGEISAPMILSTGARWVLVGHSERRTLFGETGKTVNLKLKAALAAGLQPILCIGETLEQRERGETNGVLETQLREALEGLSRDQVEKLTVAYEPVWAIGTGKVATPQQAQETHAAVYARLREYCGDNPPRVLYGGSVKPANAAELLSLPQVDGALVGGASLKAEDFAAIIQAAEALAKE